MTNAEYQSRIAEAEDDFGKMFIAMGDFYTANWSQVKRELFEINQRLIRAEQAQLHAQEVRDLRAAVDELRQLVDERLPPPTLGERVV